MRTELSSCLMVAAVLTLTAGTARAGDAVESDAPASCHVVDAITPLGVGAQVICGPLLRPDVPVAPMQLYPAPMPRSPWPLQYPPRREIGVHLSGNLTGDIFGMGGVSYTRSLTDTFALEGTGDVTHQSGDVVGFASIRAIVRRYDPAVGEVFFALGVARGFSGGNALIYPHGRGFVIGGGMQPRFSSHAAGRLEAQLVSFSHAMVGLRLTTGILIGFD